MDEDDIDHLLDEVENTFTGKRSAVSLNKRGNNGELRRNAGLKLNETDVVNDILNETSDIDSLQAKPEQKSGISNRDTEKRGKRQIPCNNIIIAGPSYIKGLSAGFEIRVCDRLRCLSCDQDVIFVDGFNWKETPGYLFLRNNYPNVDKVRCKLLPKIQSTVYFCQCSSASAIEPFSLRNYDSNLKWFCRKH